MVRKVIWSANAKAQFIQVLKYWKDRNKSDTYPKKLRTKVREAIAIIKN